MSSNQKNSLPLPGMDTAIQEALKAEAKLVIDEMSRILLEPLGDISPKAGRMEKESPLFFGTGENPTLF